MYGNASSHVQLAKDFGVSDGGVLNMATSRVITAILSLEKNWITWPTSSQREATSDQMSEFGFPYCIGFIDGVHVGLFEAPQDDPISYFNRKGFYSLNVLLICDPKKNIIAYHVGQPGKCN